MENTSEARGLKKYPAILTNSQHTKKVTWTLLCVPSSKEGHIFSFSGLKVREENGLEYANESNLINFYDHSSFEVTMGAN